MKKIHYLPPELVIYITIVFHGEKQVYKKAKKKRGVGEKPQSRKGEKKQYFNKLPNGTTITRAGGGVEAVSRSCVLVKRSASRPESWKVFSEGIFMQLFYFFVTAKGYY